MAVASISQAGFPPAGGSLALLSIPFIFTQDELLTTGDFMKQAKERGHNLSLNGLRVLHEYRLLVPLYRVSDTPVQGRRINVEINGGMSSSGSAGSQLFQADTHPDDPDNPALCRGPDRLFGSADGPTSFPAPSWRLLVNRHVWSQDVNSI
jgi:hypothetical protein